MHESFSARVGSIPSLYTLQTWQLLRSLAAGVDLLSLDGRRAVRCIDGIDDIDIVEDAARFVQVAQEVYKALGAPSRSGQFGAFSSERTEWMDHKDPVGHRASHSAPLFSSYWSSCFRFVASRIHHFFGCSPGIDSMFVGLSIFLQLFGSLDCWKVPSCTLVTSTASTRLSKQSQAWLQQSGAEHRGISERDLQRLGSCELNVQSELVKRTQGLNKMSVYVMWTT